MSKPKWKDISSFSQRDKERVPKTFELDLDGVVRPCVTRRIDCGPEDWVLVCQPWFPAWVLASRDIEQAKAEALNLVRQRLQQALRAAMEAGK